MSELKLISPMLDNFNMGDPISEHHGIRCCPAMEKDSDKKYIVKIISVPASQTQLNALLLSGAYQDEESALKYFNELSQEVIDEANVLTRLSQLEGFLPFESWQVVPMENKTGYDVYLLSNYCRTLQQHFRRNPMTHLQALNLGLDICSALAVCRRAGYLYVDLKPNNIYISPEGTYRIGDLGFIALDSMKYASLPDKYRSEYTAPEIDDAYASLNETIDIYALGLVLYQAYNGGNLPSADSFSSSEAIPAPAYADYEMAEIILKACAANPEDRWQNPIEMGQALVGYMQRNGANDTPIIPVATANETDASGQAQTEDIHVADSTVTVITESVDIDPDSISEEHIYKEDEEGNLTFLEGTDDETAPGNEAETVVYDEITEEVSDMLTQADELISHPAPDPVVAPEPIDVPIPAPLPIDDATEETQVEEEEETVETKEADTSEELIEALDDATADDSTVNESLDNKIYYDITDEPKNRSSQIIKGILITVLAAALLFAGIFFYQNYYLQPISMVLEDDDGVLTVLVNSKIDESKLTVICSDTYGNQLYAPVVDGKAVFDTLIPNSAYNVKVSINGFHRLTGNTATAYTTPANTKIVQFSVITGSENGSAIISFTTDGPSSRQWTILYSAQDEEEKSVTFAGRMTTITGLTVGKEYQFTLLAKDDITLTGITVATHTASNIVRAEHLMITNCSNNRLTASWKAPQDITVNSWTVRLYNELGFDKTLTTSETNITFEGIDCTNNYTLEVTAAGMSVNERAFVSKNAINVYDVNVEASGSNKLILSWSSDKAIKDEEWIVLYAVNGSPMQEVTSVKDQKAEIWPVVPGATYDIYLKTTNGVNVFGGACTYETAEAEVFSGYNVTAKNMDFYLCKRPIKENWDRHDLSSSDYTTTFSPSEKMSFLVRMRKVYQTVGGDIMIYYVTRNADGKIVNLSYQEKTWTQLWDYYYCEMDIPYTPTVSGDYTITVLFNGYHVTDQNFSITG